VAAVPEVGTVGNAGTIGVFGRGRVPVANIRVVVANRLVQPTATVQVAAFARVIALVAGPSPPRTVTRPGRGLMGSGPAPVTRHVKFRIAPLPTVIRFPQAESLQVKNIRRHAGTSETSDKTEQTAGRAHQ
jgi:hypothetical protein